MNGLDDLFGNIFDPTRSRDSTSGPSAPAATATPTQLLARIANAVELAAALRAHDFYKDQRDRPKTTEQRDAAQRAMDKLAPLIQLRAGRMVKGSF